MYFDAVLDESLMPLFNGTTQETKGWLKANPACWERVQVCVGETLHMFSVEEYLSR